MSDDPRLRLQRLFGGPALARLRQRLAERYARGRCADGFTLSGLDTAERRALDGLLGRPPRAAGSMRLSQAELDAALSRAGLAADLRSALEALDGPIVDRAMQRSLRADAWAAVRAAVVETRLRALLEQPAGFGLLKRMAGSDPARAGALVVAAERVLQRLPAAGISLAQLAAESVGDAHALDTGGRLAALVLGAALREVAAAADEDGDGDGDGSPAELPPRRSRDRWALLGVAVNELAAPALLLNLRAAVDIGSGQRIELARTIGEPIHLSLRCLLRDPPRWQLGGSEVFVCENPAIVASAADRLGRDCAALVCTDGMPSAAQRVLLQQLAGAGVRLRYHGDYDWPGLRIGNFVLRAFGARAWRFGVGDYRPTGGRRLQGSAVAADWDAELQPAMERCGWAQDEEAMIDALLQDLAG